MNKPVLFVTGLGRSLNRAENIKALFDSYTGDKCFMSMHENGFGDILHSRKHDLMVSDVFITDSPGKAIMCWHSIQGGKYIGFDEQGTYYKEQYVGLTGAIIAAGNGGIEMWQSATHVPTDKILPLGMPRTDRYKGKKKGDGHTVLSGKRAYLYAPTFRNIREPAMPFIDWEWLDKHLTDDELFVVKVHPYGHDLRIGEYKHIIEADKMEPSVNYLYDCDVVITDYSSIMFDGYLLKKPCVLFQKNDKYIKQRGMYLDYPKQYSSRYAENEHDLLRLIRSANTLTVTELNCLDYVASACDGHSCERICNMIDEMNTEGGYA